MDGETDKLQLNNLSDSELTRINETAKRRLNPRKFGEDWMFWKDTFQLCKDVPSLLDEIQRLRTENDVLNGQVIRLAVERDDLARRLDAIEPKMEQVQPGLWIVKNVRSVFDQKGSEVQASPPLT